MKKLLFISLLTLLSVSSFAQKIRFTDTGNFWHTYLLALELTPPIIYQTDFSYNGTILFHGIPYEKLYQNSTCIGYIREDTAAQKVFAVSLLQVGGVLDSTEHILYDYTLHTGDTFKHANTVSHYVVDMDSVLIGSNWYKTWHLAPTNIDTFVGQGGQTDYYVIEGIGCINFPLFPADPTYFESGYTLTCFSNRGVTPQLNHKVDNFFDNDSSCSETFGLAVNRLNRNTKPAAIFPNPIDKTSKIVLSYSMASGTLIVLNDVGQVIIDQPVQNKDELQIGDKITMPGIYYYRVTDNESGKAFSGKFVAQ